MELTGEQRAILNGACGRSRRQEHVSDSQFVRVELSC
jgi:hypothetical protein